MEFSQDRTANVVSEIPGADEQDVNTGDLCDFLDLILSAFVYLFSGLGDIHSQELPWFQSEQS